MGLRDEPLGGEAFRLLFDVVPRPMFAFDRTTLALIAVNDAACMHYGWSRAEFLALTLRDIRPSEDLPYLDHVIGSAHRRPEQRLAYPARHRTKDGRILDVEVEISRLEIDGHAISLAAITDLTGVAAVERRFRLLVENSADGIVVVAVGGVMTYISPGAERLMGVAPGQLAGSSALQLTTPEDLAAVRALKPGETTVVVSQIRHGDGSLRWIESSITNFALDPVIRGYVSNFRDVTARKENEAMLARMAVADRMLSVGTLAAGVAHEINNPLAYVATNLDLLAQELPRILSGESSRLSPAQALEVLADAREGATRVSGIVRDLRDLARPDDNTLSPICVAEVLAFAIKMAHHELRHRATVVVDHASGLPLILANASRLGQVFLNLLINAAQAIPEGRADSNQIKILTYRSDDARAVCVAITDTGSGIPSAIQRRIFDPFFTTKPVGDGMGLGLAISHQIVRSIGGEIAVTSTPGAGSTFTVTLPVAIGDVPAVVPEPAPGEAAARILLIDDEPAIGRAVQMLLEPDHAVTIETCARAALARFDTGEEFDVILCDLMMPEISGMEFYDHLRRVAPTHVDRVVFVTGGAFTPAARDFLAGVALPSLDKPFTESALRRAVASARR